MNLLVHLFSLLALVDVPLGGAIIEGSVAPREKFNYVVYLDILPGMQCCGAIIDDLHILTAAHCVELTVAADIQVKAGVKHLSRDSGETRGVAQIHRHPQYFPAVDDPFRIREIMLSSFAEGTERPEKMLQTANDIAILTLDKPLPLEGNIAKIEMAKTDYLPDCRTKCEFAGWGMIDQDGTEVEWMQWTELIVLQPSDCEYHNTWHRENEFCAIDDSTRTAPAKGDSGSPLVCNGVAVGVMALGYDDPDDASIFTKIYSHLDFINKVLTNDSSGPSNDI